MDNDVMTIAGTIAELRIRVQEGEEAVDHCNREMNNALAQVDHLKARAEKAEQWRPRAEAAFARAEKAERERDNLERAMIDQVCPSCEGPMTCGRCVPVAEDWTPTLASRLEKLEARVVPVFCAVCGAGYATGFVTCPAGHRR